MEKNKEKDIVIIVSIVLLLGIGYYLYNKKSKADALALSNLQQTDAAALTAQQQADATALQTATTTQANEDFYGANTTNQIVALYSAMLPQLTTQPLPTVASQLTTYNNTVALIQTYINQIIGILMADTYTGNVANIAAVNQLNINITTLINQISHMSLPEGGNSNWMKMSYTISYTIAPLLTKIQ